MARFPDIKDFDIVKMDKCSICGSTQRLLLHHEVPISFKWLREYLGEVMNEGSPDDEIYQQVENTLSRKYYSQENHSVICKKCQHKRFRTYLMCHICDRYEEPGAYNACAICFRSTKKRDVRKDKLEEKERTLAAIEDILTEYRTTLQE